MAPDSFNLSELQAGTNSIEIGNRLQQNGYFKLILDDESLLSEEERWCARHWESVFRNAFNCDKVEKHEHWPPFATVKGYTVGYRVDGEREFIETRLSGTSSQGIEPNITNINSIDHISQYVLLVKTIILMQHKIGKLVLGCIAETLGVDEKYFHDLIDDIPSLLPSSEVPNIITDELSSSLLRICNYPSEVQLHDNIAFGAHTDVSLVTLGLCASYPGLEVRDLLTDEWIQIEKEVIESSHHRDCSSHHVSPLPHEISESTHQYPTTLVSTEGEVEEQDKELSLPVMTVFVGDIMQLLTRSIYRATVHRVVVRPLSQTSPTTTLPESSNCTISAATAADSHSRVSCPFILRGRHATIIPPVAIYTRFPSSLLSPPVSPAPPSSSTPTSSPPPPPPSSAAAPPISSLSAAAAAAAATTSTNPSTDIDSPCSPFPELPDLEGSSMKLLHKLLDLKRQKCLRDNTVSLDGESNADWVLSAYTTGKEVG